MAGVAKWLRQWFVVPPFVGSSPIVRPLFNLSVRLEPSTRRGISTFSRTNISTDWQAEVDRSLILRSST